MTPDKERWIEAAAIDRLHGENALDLLIEEIAALDAVGDVAGIERCTQIIECLVQMAERGQG